MDYTSVGTPALWGGFILFVIAMLALDLGVFHRKSHAISIKEALLWSILWVALSLIFNVGIYLKFGSVRGLEFFVAYLIEKALSVDNLFVFLVIFSYFAVPREYEHRVLFWGIVGALVFRAIFILLGGAILHKFEWTIYLFGALLLYTGYKLLRKKDENIDPDKNILVKFCKRFIPLVTTYHGKNFFTFENGKWFATPLFIALVTIESSDIVFAVDSIPAVLAVSRDSFIVFTSNIFAILGLRALYFLLAGMMHKFTYMKYGLSIVLIFIGAKMMLAKVIEIPIVMSLCVVAFLIGGSIALSFVIVDKKKKEH